MQTKYFEYKGVSLMKEPSNSPSCQGCYLHGENHHLCDSVNDYLANHKLGNCWHDFEGKQYSIIKLVNK